MYALNGGRLQTAINIISTVGLALSVQHWAVGLCQTQNFSGLEGVDAVLEEGAANVEELKVIWGNPDEPLDFEGFSAGPGQELGMFGMVLRSHPQVAGTTTCSSCMTALACLSSMR